MFWNAVPNITTQEEMSQLKNSETVPSIDSIPTILIFRKALMEWASARHPCIEAIWSRQTKLLIELGSHKSYVLECNTMSTSLWLLQPLQLAWLDTLGMEPTQTVHHPFLLHQNSQELHLRYNLEAVQFLLIISMIPILFQCCKS